jgi:hypothetical protein
MPVGDDRGLLARPRVRLALAAVWIALGAYAVTAAPPADPALERALWTARFGDVDGIVVAVFLALGINADLFVVLLLRDSRFRRVPGWPVALASFVLGSFVLLPYLAVRGAPRRPPRAAGPVTRVVSARPVGWLIVAGFVALIGLAVTRGDPGSFARAFGGSALVHVMTLDLAVECVLLWVLVVDARRVDPPHHEPRLARVALAVPVVGPALWNALVVHDPPRRA